ncbi:MAG: 6-bladed beta-propeller, partial [Gammaproteobacteria bacterium]|nr:6-bladed beta-propeller [Gammaproteobacteria bacterium]
MHNYSYVLKSFVFLLLSTLLSAVVQAEAIPKKNVKFIRDLNAEQGNGLLLPSDVAVTNKFIYVVDGGKHRIVVFDLQGEYKFSFGKNGKGKTEFNYPVGIDVASDSTVYVADSGNKRIQVFNTKGKYIRQFKVVSGRYRIRPVDVLV